MLSVHKMVKISARMRVDQAQPIRGRSDCSIRGKTMPPVAPPVAAIPVASARRARKKWPTEETAGVKMSDVPAPASRLIVRMKCQYSIVMLAICYIQGRKRTYRC
jgi:hypothetical protein